MDNPKSAEQVAKENEEALKKTQEEIDKQEAEGEPPAPTPSEPIPSPSKPADDEEPSPSAPIPSPSEEIPSPSAPPDEEDKSKDGDKKETDFRKLYNQSSKEALTLAAKNKKYEQISDIESPNEKELKQEYSEWDDMTPTEQKLATQVLWDKKRFAVIDQINKDSKDVDAWDQKVNNFVTDPKVLAKNTELEGKIDEFVTFATKPTRRGIDMEDLVLAFLGDWTKNKPAPKKGQMFEQGSAGGNGRAPKQKDDKISLEEASQLMKTNYSKYKEYLIADKIKYE